MLKYTRCIFIPLSAFFQSYYCQYIKLSNIDNLVCFVSLFLCICHYRFRVFSHHSISVFYFSQVVLLMLVKKCAAKYPPPNQSLHFYMIGRCFTSTHVRTHTFIPKGESSRVAYFHVHIWDEKILNKHFPFQFKEFLPI